MACLMIHDIRPAYFDLDITDFKLTFDDGLYTQYYYYPKFSNGKKTLTYFIITAFVQTGPARGMYEGDYISWKKSKAYMADTVVRNDYSHFMRLEEIRELAGKADVEIGAHSHFHDVILTPRHPKKRKPLPEWKKARFGHHPAIGERDFAIRSRLAFRGFDIEKGVLFRRTDKQWEAYVRQDTEMCLDWFERRLGVLPQSYCFPFNEHSEELIAILKSYGFKRFYSARPGDCPEVIGRTDIDSLTP